MSRPASASLNRQLLLPVLLVGLAVLFAVLAILIHLRERTVEAAGFNTAKSTAHQIITLRTFYTNEIAARAKKAGMKLNYDFASADNTLPLPATLVKTLGEAVGRDQPGMAIRLYSRHPFPVRAATERYDGFELAALAALEKAPDDPQSLLETVNGKTYARYAVADRMKEGCVACHNSHPESPKRDWKVGDVRGVIEVKVPVDEVTHHIDRGIASLALSILAGFCLLGAVAVLVSRRVSRSVRVLGDRVIQVERDGDFTVRIEAERADEVGRIVGAFNSLIEHCQGIIAEIRRDAAQLFDEAQRLADASEQVSDATVQQSERAASTAAALEQMSASIAQVADRAGAAAQLSDHTVALAEEGGEVARQTTEALGRASATVDTLAKLVASLDQRSSQISGFAQSIRGIADQTNLLALNAAIEAARAGETGRGFAVVADEVRKLAERTGAATEEISRTIAVIQRDISEAVGGMQESRQAVQGSVDLAAKAAAALAGIRRSARETRQHISDIATATSEQDQAGNAVAANMEQISRMAGNNAHAIGGTADAAEQVRVLAEQLQHSVARYQV